MNQVTVNLQTTERKWRKSLIQIGQLTADNVLLFELIEQLLERTLTEHASYLSQARSLVTPVSKAFGLSDQEARTLRTMVPLSLVGMAINGGDSPSDIDAISQIEWLLRDSPSLSIVGTAMSLSLEEGEGTGPLGLDSFAIPELSKAFRCVRDIAGWQEQHDDVSVLHSLISRTYTEYLDAETLERLCSGISPKTDVDIRWLDVYQLRPGMQVMDDVRNPEGLLLIARYTTLSSRLIDSLQSYAALKPCRQQIPVTTA
jgi:hypothetical protein